jgi:hypothetical protein
MTDSNSGSKRTCFGPNLLAANFERLDGGMAHFLFRRKDSHFGQSPRGFRVRRARQVLNQALAHGDGLWPKHLHQGGNAGTAYVVELGRVELGVGLVFLSAELRELLPEGVGVSVLWKGL